MPKILATHENSGGCLKYWRFSDSGSGSLLSVIFLGFLLVRISLAIPWKFFKHNNEKKNIEPGEEQRIVFC
jgi:hypothetical protein